MPASTSREPEVRRRRHWFLFGGLILLALVLGAIGWAIVRPDAIAERVKERALADASQQLGRKVDAGPVHVRLFPRFGATLSKLSVEGGPGEPELLSVGDTRVSVKLWPLIRSRGQDVQVSSVELGNVYVNLVRRSNGTWSYEDLIKKKEQPAKETAGEEKKPRELVVSEVRVTNGQIKVIDHSGAKTGEAPSAIALSQLDATAHNVGLDRPVSIHMKGALASDRPNLTADLEANADRSKVSGKIALNGVAIENLHGVIPAGLSNVLTGGRLSTNLNISTPSQGTYGVDGTAKLDQLTLRGSPAGASLRLNATMKAAQPSETLAGRIEDLRVQGQGVDLTGNATFNAGARKADFTIDGSKLDLATLLALKPQSPPRQELIPPSMRSEVERAQVTGNIHIAEVQSGSLHAHDLRAKAALSNGVLSLPEATVGLYSGRAMLSGTTINLVQDKPTWNTKAKLEAVDVRSALQELSGSSPLTGLLSGEMALNGQGNNWSELRMNLTGRGKVGLTNASLTGTDLSSDIAQPLTTALHAFGMAGPAGKVENAGKTVLKDFSAQFQVKDGWVNFSQPMTIEAPFGGLALTGRVGLDNRVDLKGDAKLSPQFMTSIGASQLAKNGPLSVPLQLGGTLQKPEIVGVDWTGVAQAALSGALQQQVMPKGKNNPAEQAPQQLLRGLLHGS